VYNRSIRRSKDYRLRLAIFFFWFVALFSSPARSGAGSLEDGARALAGKVASSLHGALVRCEQRNLSFLKETDFLILGAAFQDELQHQGVKISPKESGIELVLTVTGNPTGYTGVAQIRREGNVEIFFEGLGRLADASTEESRAGFALEKAFLFAQDGPIVDVVLAHDSKSAYALGRSEIYSYEMRGDHWLYVQMAHFPSRRASERDLRGFLDLGGETEAVYLPGEYCRISTPDRKGLSCEAFPKPLPVRAVSADVIAGKKTPVWFSAAQFGPEGATSMIITGQDGLARLYEEGPNPVTTFPGWGSEIVSVSSGCGRGWQILVTGTGDWTKADTVEAMEIQGRRARAVSSRIELAGPVIALHAGTTRSTGDTSADGGAVAIVRNLQTGRYEAYRLSLTCEN
jgi:hypothetical protein